MDKKTIIEKVKNAGVVGAGGGGFPTHVKISADVDTVIANGVECEPLLSTDRYLLRTKAKEIIDGLRLVQQTTGAKNVYIALKRKYKRATLELNKILGQDSDIKIFLLDNYYPAGDEFEIVYNITQKVIPEGGIPLDVGVVVCNVNTLLNVYLAVNKDNPVFSRWVSIRGAVKEPYIAEVPLGISAGELIDMAQPLISDYKIIVGGPMMGSIQERSFKITKLCGGIIVLGNDHPVIVKQMISLSASKRRGKSICDQCFDCTIVCPRNLLGHSLEPHKIMRMLFIDPSNAPGVITNSYLCCECGLCDMYACPMDISPRRLLIEAKGGKCEREEKRSKRPFFSEQIAAKGIKKPPTKKDITPHSERDFRRVNTDRLMYRIGVKKYDVGTFNVKDIIAKKVKILLCQHIGVPGVPIVKKRQNVTKGELIADIPHNAIGAKIHSSIAGTIGDINSVYIEVENEG